MASEIPNLGPQLNITGWVLTGASGVFLALRVHCKILQKRSLWWDDHLLIASWVSASRVFTLLQAKHHPPHPPCDLLHFVFSQSSPLTSVKTPNINFP